MKAACSKALPESFRMTERREKHEYKEVSDYVQDWDGKFHDAENQSGEAD